MQTFAVSEEKNRQLRGAMEALGIREEDLEESFVRSSGAGGQHVNKTSTCVRLRHKPSGIEVKCMRDRSQSVNRFLARRELVERFATESGVATRKSEEAERLKRRKSKQRQRSRRKYPASALSE